MADSRLNNDRSLLSGAKGDHSSRNLWRGPLNQELSADAVTQTFLGRAHLVAAFEGSEGRKSPKSSTARHRTDSCWRQMTMMIWAPSMPSWAGCELRARPPQSTKHTCYEEKPVLRKGGVAFNSKISGSRSSTDRNAAGFHQETPGIR